MQPWAPARLLPFPARPPAGRHRRRTRSTHLPLPPTWPPARLRGRRFRGWFARSSATHPPHWQLPALWAAPATAAGRATSSTSQAALQDAPLPRRAAQPSTACSRSLPCAHRVGALLATPRPRHPPPLPATPRPSTLSASPPREVATLTPSALVSNEGLGACPQSQRGGRHHRQHPLLVRARRFGIAGNDKPGDDLLGHQVHAPSTPRHAEHLWLSRDVVLRLMARVRRSVHIPVWLRHRCPTRL